MNSDVRNIKFVFFGTPEFAVGVLEKLLDAGLPPIAVVCNPDRPVGRKKIVTPPPVKVRIMNHESGIKDKIQIFQPEKLDEKFIADIKALEPDYFVIAAFSKILRADVLAIPAKGVLGVHPSLLPKHRGATPLQSAILDGDSETGVTIFLVDTGIDHGPILVQEKYELSARTTYRELSETLSSMGGILLAKTLPAFDAGEIAPLTQSEGDATLTKKFTSDDAKIDEPLLDAALDGDFALSEAIDRKIRALNPEPGTWTLRQPSIDKAQDGQGKPQRVKLLEADIDGGALVLKKIQVEGKKPEEVE
ncbi:MAG: methionyl-tRNA formyltransferase [bacterium]|nr:methionyl-tRNA formyltransferase [bacterium]